MQTSTSKLLKPVSANHSLPHPKKRAGGSRALYFVGWRDRLFSELWWVPRGRSSLQNSCRHPNTLTVLGSSTVAESREAKRPVNSSTARVGDNGLRKVTLADCRGRSSTSSDPTYPSGISTAPLEGTPGCPGQAHRAGSGMLAQPWHCLMSSADASAVTWV